jgi:hypothetical protein
MTDEKKQVTVRDDRGRFVQGVSGNPAGAQKGSKHRIVALRESTELALRDYMGHPENQQKAMQAIDRVMDIAIGDDDKLALQAIKLLFDKTISNARSGTEEEAGKQRPIAIQIINQTEQTGSKPVTMVDGEVID